jgi:hypothetical protein
MPRVTLGSITNTPWPWTKSTASGLLPVWKFELLD